MELTQNEKLIHQMYIAYYQRPADPEGLQYWLDQLETAGDWNAVSAAFGAPENEEYQGLYGEMSREELVAELYQSSFNRAAAPEEIDFWAGSEHSDLDLAFAIINGAQNDDLATVNAKVAFSAETVAYVETNEGYEQIEDPNALMANIDADSDVSPEAVADLIGEVDPGEPQEPSVPGENYVLTDGRDNVTGTADDDTFYADAGQNQNGTIANAFATGDFVDGGAGRDKIVAAVMEDQESDSGIDANINARTVNVEEVYIENLAMNGAGDAVTVDAGRMDSVDQFWSDNSGSDVVFDDVRLGSKLNVTKDITFGLRNADVDAGLDAWFDTNSLTNEGTSTVNSALVIRAADVSTETPAAPLTNVELEIGFTLGGAPVEFTVQSTDGTYAGLAAAIDAALTEQGLGGLNVTLANPYNEVVFAGNNTQLPFTAQEVLITDPAGNEFDNVSFQTSNIESVPGGFLLAGNAAPQDPSISTTMIESNLVLDNAGRGSTAGDVYIGGMSNSGRVVEKLNLTVDRSSKIDELFTGSGRAGNTAFQVIEVDSAAGRGDLSINDVGNVNNFDATAFEGQNLEVSGQAGMAEFDPDSEEFALNNSHVYNTGASNDDITVNWSLDKAAEFNDYSLSVNTGAGSDSVHLISNFGEGGSAQNDLLDQQDLGDVVVNTGSGDDMVRTEGAGEVIIVTGAGNDAVYTDNSGQQWMDQDANAATWLVGAQNAALTDIRGDSSDLDIATAGSSAVMYGAEVLVTFSGAGTGGAVTSENAAYGDNGFESVADIRLPAGEVFGNRTHLNNAIKRAINDNDVLNKLLVASDGPNNTLVIRSLIDGQFVADDLDINFRAATTVEDEPRYLSDAEQDRIETAIQEATDNSEYELAENVFTESEDAINGINGLGGASVQATGFTGTASVLDNTGNVVDAGTGNDVVVLSTHNASNEVISFSDYGNGKNTIVNFDDGDGAEGDSPSAGLDLLNFQNYLTSMEPDDTSTSVVSQSRVDFSVNGAAADSEVGANTVTLVEFTAATDQTFAGIGSANLLKALNDSDDEYGNINASTSLEAAGAYVGDSYKSVLMIENANNEGEYQVWDITVGLNSDETATIATQAQLIGTYDFGASLDNLSEDNLVA